MMNIEAISKVIGNKDFYIDENGKVFVEGKEFEIDAKKLADAESEVIKSNLLERLMDLCDMKHESAKKEILGHKATPLQIERYKDKYNRAKEGKFSSEINKTIIKKFEKMQLSISNLIDGVEEYRGFAEKLIEDDKFDKAKTVIEAIETCEIFKQETVKADIEKLIKDL